MDIEKIVGALMVTIVVVTIGLWSLWEIITNRKKYNTINIKDTVDLANNPEFKKVKNFCETAEKRINKLEKVTEEILTDIRGIKVRLSSKGL